MLTDHIRACYRRNRAEITRLPAEIALLWARNDPESKYPGFTWTQSSGSTVMVGAGTVDDFEVRVTVTFDDDPIIDGRFTDQWSPAAVQNPEWRPTNSSRRYRYFIGGCSDPGAERKELSRMGVDRHRAYTMAQADAREEARRAIEPELYIIRASAYQQGMLLGEETIHGVDAPDNPGGARQCFIASAGDLIYGAVRQARDTVAQLQSKTLAITVDGAHVLLDGLNQLRGSIEGGYNPWADFDGDPSNDPKVTAYGYKQLMASTRAALTEIIEKG